MNRISPLVRGLVIIGVVSAAIVALDKETSLITAAYLVRFAFFIAIAIVIYMFWRDFGRREISLWPAFQQGVFYAAVGLLIVDLGWFFLVGLSGLDALVFFLVAGACVFTGYRTWRQQHTYG